MKKVGRHVLLPELSWEVVGAAIDVHRELGPGLLERVYHEAMEYELTQRGLAFESKVKIPVVYKGKKFNFYYEADIVVEECMVLELKSVEGILKVHTAQALTYMRLLDCRVGYVLNFNVANLTSDGCKRLVL